MNDNDTPQKALTEHDDILLWALGIVMIAMLIALNAVLLVEAFSEMPGLLADRQERRLWQENPRRDLVEHKHLFATVSFMGMIFVGMFAARAGHRGGFFPLKIYNALAPVRRAWGRTYIAWALAILAEGTQWPKYLPRVSRWSPGIHLLMIGALVIPSAFFMVEQTFEIHGLMPKIYAASPFLHEALVWAAVVGFAVMVLSILLVAVYFLIIVVCFSIIKVTKLIRASKIRWAVAIIQKRRRLTA